MRLDVFLRDKKPYFPGTRKVDKSITYGKVDDIIKTLSKDCAPFLRELEKCKQDKFVYRGTDRNIKSIKKMKVRKDRIPKDMPNDLHDELDDEFKKTFGVYVRSEGVFTTGNIHIAAHYGKQHLFFPIGKYRYVWSDEVSDLYTWFEDSSEIYEPDEQDLGMEWDNQYGEGNEGTWYYDDNDTGECDIDKAIEVAIETEGDEENYYERLMKWIPEVSFQEYMRIRLKEWESDRNNMIERTVDDYTDKNLNKAIMSKHEITFVCDYYYLVNLIHKQDLAHWIWG